MQSLKDSELHYRRLFETAQDGILFLDAATGMIEEVNQYLIKMLGFSSEELKAKKLWEVGAFRNIKASKEAFDVLREDEYIRFDNLPLKTKSRHLIQVEFIGNVYFVNGKKVIQCIIRDNAEYKRILIALQENEKKYRDLVNQSTDGMFIIGMSGKLLFVNTAMCEQLLYTEQEFLSMKIWDILPKQYNKLYRKRLKKILNGESIGEAVEYEVRGKDGKSHYVEVISAPHYSGKNLVGFQGIAREISLRKQDERIIRQQLTHLTALSAIDRAINASFNMNLTLTEVLIHVTAELEIDAADILVFHTPSPILELSAELGFRSKTIMKSRIPMQESHAGRVILERQLVQIPDLREESEHLFPKSFLDEEEFVSYLGVPLIVKGQVNGVLEVFHRSTLEPDTEWLDFLNAMAGQAAIAIENSNLFEGLQRSNLELGLAYDATIEGWSRALDLRDRETQWHTQRVTAMTVNLARFLGLDEAELVQVRWGALLHDIGKMGVPDKILHKPGPLTDEEWVVMKKHPTYAYELLLPIRYLRSALDIPHYHHERWDGTGYPNGLKTTQIPLTARIFAVVDVWDSLTSDRPYRAAWTEEKAREHIRASAGTHFDPQVVDAFMQLPTINSNDELEKIVIRG